MGITPSTPLLNVLSYKAVDSYQPNEPCLAVKPHFHQDLHILF